jgi:hypothetical protein
MSPPPYRPSRIDRPDGRATFAEHDDGRRVIVGDGIPGVHYLDREATQRWVDEVVGAAGAWVTADELLGRS